MYYCSVLYLAFGLISVQSLGLRHTWHTTTHGWVTEGLLW